jgi:flagellar FliJ protein
VTRSSRLEPFARLAEQRQQGAARSLQESHAELSRYRGRLDDLIAYRAEYLGRLDKVCLSGGSAEHIKRFMSFLARLDEAIGELQAVIRLSEQRCERCRDEWLATRARFRALDEVITRFRGEEERHRLRREQRDADERAQRPGRDDP